MYFGNCGLRKTWLNKCLKKYHFRGYFGERYTERERALFKSRWQDLYHSHRSLLKQLGWKKSFLMICKVLKLFVNALTARDKYPLRDRNNLTQPIQMLLFEKEKNLSPFLLHFWNLHEILNISQKKKTPIADEFPKLWTPKNVLK